MSNQVWRNRQGKIPNWIMKPLESKFALYDMTDEEITDSILRNSLRHVWIVIALITVAFDYILSYILLLINSGVLFGSLTIPNSKPMMWIQLANTFCIFKFIVDIITFIFFMMSDSFIQIFLNEWRTCWLIIVIGMCISSLLARVYSWIYLYPSAKTRRMTNNKKIHRIMYLVPIILDIIALLPKLWVARVYDIFLDRLRIPSEALKVHSAEEWKNRHIDNVVSRLRDVYPDGFKSYHVLSVEAVDLRNNTFRHILTERAKNAFNDAMTQKDKISPAPAALTEFQKTP